MKNYKDILEKNNLKVDKYTIKGKSTIIDTNKGKFVLKQNENNNIYNYLSSRNFDNYPKVLDYDKNTILFEYLNNIEYDNEQKALDIMHVLAILHRKTTYYKEITYDDAKIIYEKIKNDLDYINNYYLDVINSIESNIYWSPSEYLIARNISKIFSCIYYCNNELDNWLELMKDKQRKRVVMLHNNLKIDNIIKNKNIYLISWQKSKIDLPIYDLVNFYNMYALDFDFDILFEEYQKVFPLLEEEIKLMSILISIPSKINYCDNEYKMVKNVREILDKIYKTEKILTSKEKETTST